MTQTEEKTLRADQQLIASLIAPQSRVLDVGCGTGELLEYLVKHQQVDGRGLEISQEGVRECVRKGLAVVQGDAATDLLDYPDKSFDFIVLSNTIQAMHQPKQVLQQLLRIGNNAVVSLPNFGFWKIRLSLLFNGKMPVNKMIPYQWYDTPNIHFCTIADFESLCEEVSANICKSYTFSGKITGASVRNISYAKNILAEQGVFLLTSIKKERKQ